MPSASAAATASAIECVTPSSGADAYVVPPLTGGAPTTIAESRNVTEFA